MASARAFVRAELKRPRVIVVNALNAFRRTFRALTQTYDLVATRLHTAKLRVLRCWNLG